MTVLTPLTAAERFEHRTVRIGSKDLRTLANRAAVVRDNRKLLPAAFELRGFEDDTAQAVALGECLAVIERLRGAVRDTLMVVGHRASVAATAAYAHIKVASNSAERIKPTVAKTVRRGSRSTVRGSEPAEVQKPAEPVAAAEPAEPPAPPADKAA